MARIRSDGLIPFVSSFGVVNGQLNLIPPSTTEPKEALKPGDPTPAVLHALRAGKDQRSLRPLLPHSSPQTHKREEDDERTTKRHQEDLPPLQAAFASRFDDGWAREASQRRQCTRRRTRSRRDDHKVGETSA